MSGIKDWLKKALRHIVSKGFVIGITIGIIFSGVPGTLVTSSAKVGNPNSDVALSFIELIALMIPAIAILLQANLSVSERSGLKLLGYSGTVRKISFWIATISLSGLALALITLQYYLTFPDPLSAALLLIVSSTIVMALLPTIPAILYQWSGSDDMGSFSDSLSAYSSLKQIEDIDEDILDIIADQSLSDKYLDVISPQEDEVSKGAGESLKNSSSVDSKANGEENESSQEKIDSVEKDSADKATE